MARPKDPSISQAFVQKSNAAGDKLRRFQDQQLSTDMNRLFTEGLHSDMTVDLQHSTLNLHSCVIKARSLELYKRLFSLPGSCLETKSVLMKSFSHADKIGDLFRMLYCENDITKCLQDFAQILSSEDKSDCNGGVLKNQTLNNSNADRVESTPEVLTNMNTSHVNGIHGDVLCNGDTLSDSTYEVSDKKLYEMANEIVDIAVKNAVNVSKGQPITEVQNKGSAVNGLHINEAIELENDHDGKVNDVEDNGVKTINKDSMESDNHENQESTCEKVCDNIETIRSTKDESCDLLWSLLEKKCGLQTVLTPSGQLGEDLLRLWVTETDCDAQILIHDKVFMAHKCILSCRSMYFDAMLGGSWRESDQEQIILEGIDGGTMQQTLMYLYGGVVEIDPTCSLGGLVMMSDMYSLDGLKEVVAFNLNKDYCHFFHRPCPTCIVGVPDALTLTLVYNMEAMRDKCVKWINKNFMKVWPTKQFAHLPQEVLDFCVTSAIQDLAMDNVIDIMVECRQLNEIIPRLKWSECILDMITRLMDAAIEFASQKFVNIVGSKTFRNIDKQGIAFNKQPLEDIFGMVIMALSPENSCQAYLSLEKWTSMFKAREDEKFPLYSEEFIEFVEFLFKKCKEHLCLYIHQAAHTVEWTYLSKESQKEIMEEANYVFIANPNKGRMARPQLTSMQRKVTGASGLSLKEYFDQHFGVKTLDKKSKSPSPANHISNTKTQTKSKSNLPTSGAKKNKTVAEKEKTTSRPTAARPSTSKGANSDTINKSGGTSTVKLKQKEATRLADATSGKTGSTSSKVKGKTDAKSENSRTVEHKSTENLEQICVDHEVDNEINDNDADNPLTSESADYTLHSLQQALGIEREPFVPQFGHSRSQSADGVVADRQGLTTVVQRPARILNVEFTMLEL